MIDIFKTVLLEKVITKGIEIIKEVKDEILNDGERKEDDEYQRRN